MNGEVEMRCIACNKSLSDFEATRKDSKTGEFIDMCNDCYIEVEEEFASIEREDLKHADDESEPSPNQFSGG